MLTKSAALELSPYNIRVNAIAPGAVRTRLLEALFLHLPKEQMEAEIQKMGNATLVKRVGMPDDMAGAMIFLASDAASYITGEVITIDGGALLAE